MRGRNAGGPSAYGGVMEDRMPSRVSEFAYYLTTDCDIANGMRELFFLLDNGFVGFDTDPGHIMAIYRPIELGVMVPEYNRKRYSWECLSMAGEC